MRGTHLLPSHLVNNLLQSFAKRSLLRHLTFNNDRDTLCLRTRAPLINAVFNISITFKPVRSNFQKGRGEVKSKPDNDIFNYFQLGNVFHQKNVSKNECTVSLFTLMLLNRQQDKNKRLHTLKEM